MKKIIKIASLLIVLSLQTLNSFGYIKICRIYKGENGYDKITENHNYSNPFQHRHLLDCEDPGTKKCEWTTYQPGADEIVLPRVDWLVDFAETKVLQGCLPVARYLFSDALVIVTGNNPNYYYIEIYTIVEATELGLL
ncbi:MAG: hypothetical protein SGJ10_01640 [Bacteroidota bacterium]|nr:hypothetical protein [Bacteroidota bacterium]